MAFDIKVCAVADICLGRFGKRTRDRRMSARRCVADKTVPWRAWSDGSGLVLRNPYPFRTQRRTADYFQLQRAGIHTALLYTARCRTQWPGENSAVFLATSEASSMRWLPRRYGRGSAIGAERQSRITLGQVEGVVLLLIGIALLVAKSRQHRAHMAATQRTLRESGDPNGSPHSLL